MVEFIIIYPKLVIIFFAEIVVFWGFVYFVSTRTNFELSRRWRASALVSVLSGLSIHSLFIVLFILGWISDGNFEMLLIDLPKKFLEGLLLMISLATYITMPVIIIGIFFAYINFLETGDRLIEKYWRNPKINYSKNAKPPYLKF